MKINNQDFNLNELLGPYLKKWPFFLISMAIMLIISFFYIKSKAPVYKVQTSILIKDAKKMSSDVGDMSILQGVPGFGGMGTNSIENELEILQSKTIIEDVIKDLKLQTPIYAKQSFYDIELYKDTSPINIVLVKEDAYAEKPKQDINVKIKNDGVVLSSGELKSDINAGYGRLIRLPYADIIITKNENFDKKKADRLKLEDIYFKYVEFEDAVEDYQKSMSVDLLDKDATVIGINMTDPNKDKAADVLNTLVKKYNLYAVNDKNTESEKTKSFIDERIAIISKELGSVESEKQNFKTKNQIVDVQSDAKINLEVNQEAKKKMLELDTQIELNNMLSNYLNGQSSSQLIPVNVGLENPVAVSSINNYNKLVQERSRLLDNATPTNPVIKDLDIQISNLRQNIRESLLKDKGALQISRNNILSEKIKSANSISTIPEKERVFRNIERQQQIKENLFLLLLQKREEAAISMAITSNKARVVDSAYALKKPVAPRKMFILGGALLIGFLLPAIYLLIKELFNDKIIVKGDIEKLSNIPVIGEIPKTLKKSDQLIKNNDLSPLAESFRILITNLRFILRKNDNAKTIMVTSSMKGEGKTFVSVNLALALTTPNKKVLVIGSDIRNPQLQRYNPSMKVARGLTEYLNSDVKDINEIIHPSGFISGTDFIYSGAIPPNPTDLLQNNKYEDLLNEVRDRYDYIILDTAPLMPVTDSFLIAHLADATVYVVRSEISMKSYMDFANKNTENKNLKNPVFVVNDIRKTNFAYGNQYGYSNEEKKWWHFLRK
ncbi:GumC family protein [Chryseobacterium sp. CT-SW4]|uniref:GumC family protein n=1 Tax=Chryseobacterium sp. SW-1 TaxID=3157343 RepID=UPI003B022032